MKVLKFGGTSLGNATMMRRVAGIIELEKDCMVVCSAMAGVTDRLIEVSNAWREKDYVLAEKLKDKLFHHFESVCFDLMNGVPNFNSCRVIVAGHFKEINLRLKDNWSTGGEKWLLTRGEIITTQIFDHFLNHAGVSVHWLDAMDFIQKRAGGEPAIEDIRNKLNCLKEYSGIGRYLTQGFICRDENGESDNLARGGSDYSATLIGAAVEASEIEIWTDIDGLHNNDPRYVPNTAPIRELSFSEAAELAYFGAKILHPTCVWPASANSIPIILKNTMEPQAAGSKISESSQATGIRAVAAKDNITVIRIKSARMLNAYGFLRRIFEIFEINKTPIDVITTSEVAVSITIDNPSNLNEILMALASLGEVTVEKNQSIICVVGDVLKVHQGYAVKIMEALRPLQVKLISFGGSRNNISMVVPSEKKTEALVNLHQALFYHSDSLNQSPVNYLLR